uniref:Deoxyguanosinetriphosphate triphosphohydrolase-like protein n=1 Tax=uncultured Armatimonadetes bacterium TaxID=157466 RepID=A0A6J4JIN3_9BACT|nr:dNTP triphosphohydrolase, broad substrate specificity [uncultured Armatimonadetes bacterium]
MNGSTTADPWSERRGDGRTTVRPHDTRSPYERDRARLIHSAAFRRLQAKTQVLGIAEGDFHRTRLTHSMEVAQIARGLVLQLEATGGADGADLPSQELIESVAFAHDLGHPPFGHGGEVALNYAMRGDAGGFEGNGQSLRLLARLESYEDPGGLDLTRRTLLGILKYPRPYAELRREADPPAVERFTQLRAAGWKPPKCYLDTESDVVDWLLAPLSASDRHRFRELAAAPAPAAHGKTRHKSFDATLMELADDVAYGVHDFEDGVALGLIGRDAAWEAVFRDVDRAWAGWVGLDLDGRLADDLFRPRHEGGRRKKAIGALVHAMIASVRVERLPEFDAPIVAFRARLEDPARRLLDALQALVVTHVIRLQSVQSLEYRGQYMVLSLFEALESEPERLLSDSFLPSWRAAQTAAERKRVICDYVAGMTDEYATRMFERLFVPRQGTAFQRM